MSSVLLLLAVAAIVFVASSSASPSFLMGVYFVLAEDFLVSVAVAVDGDNYDLFYLMMDEY